MPDNGYSVRVTGLREVVAALKQVDSGLGKEVQREFKTIAEHVADTAHGKVPRKTGAAAGSIRARATQRGAGIAFSDNDGTVPYMPWLNFGGHVGRKRAQFRAIKDPDYFIYTSIAEKRDETIRAVDDAIKKVAGHASFDTRGSIT